MEDEMNEKTDGGDLTEVLVDTNGNNKVNNYGSENSNFIITSSNKKLDSFENISNVKYDKGTRVWINVLVGFSPDKGTIWMKFDQIINAQGQEFDVGMKFKLKAKVFSPKRRIKKKQQPQQQQQQQKEEYVCKVQSHFMDLEEIYKHVFCFKNAKEESLCQQYLQIALYGKQSNKSRGGILKKNYRFGETIIELKGLIDINGYMLKLHKMLLPSKQNSSEV